MDYKIFGIFEFFEFGLNVHVVDAELLEQNGFYFLKQQVKIAEL